MILMRGLIIFLEILKMSLQKLCFTTFCLPDYGLCLWNIETIFSKHIFKIFNTSFSNALKEILDVPLCSSSHATANICNHFLLRHHLILVQSRNMKRVLCSKNNLLRICMPYIKSGFICSSLSETLEVKYNINSFEYELEILKSRLTWVQRHEESRAQYDFYGI